MLLMTHYKSNFHALDFGQKSCIILTVKSWTKYEVLVQRGWWISSEIYIHAPEPHVAVSYTININILCNLVVSSVHNAFNSIRKKKVI